MGLGPLRGALFRPGSVGHLRPEAARHHDRQLLFHHLEHSGGHQPGRVRCPEEEHLGGLFPVHSHHGSHFSAVFRICVPDPVFFMLQAAVVPVPDELRQ